jgi:hypothetical protein
MTGIDYHPHARTRMRRRGISEAQVEQAPATYDTTYPAQPLPGRKFRSTVYVATVDDRRLRVYVEQGRSPTYVRTVAWEDDE